LITDTIGVLIGSFYIPNPNVFGNPRFETGSKLFRITNSPSNSLIDSTTTSAEEKFYSEGKINRVQENILSVRTVRTETQTVTESRTESLTGPTAVVATTIVGNTLPPYVPPAPPVVPADPPTQVDYEQEPAPSSYSPVENTPSGGGEGGGDPIPGPYVESPDPGNSCPDPNSLILMSDGSQKMSGDLKVGDIVRTQHEETLEWGDYKVSHVSIINDSKKVKLTFSNSEIICSTSHKFYANNKWTECVLLSVGDIVSGQTLQSIENVENGDVVKITVETAHTYICEGLLSHNKSPVDPEPPTVTNNKNKGCKPGMEYLNASTTIGSYRYQSTINPGNTTAFSVPLQTACGKTWAQIADKKGKKAANKEFKNAGIKPTTTDKTTALQQKAINFKTTKKQKNELPLKGAPGAAGAARKQLEQDRIIKPQKTRGPGGLLSITPTTINNVPAGKGKKKK
jgi:hypothetical protein